MDKNTSILLDIIRFTAAIFVFLDHFSQVRFSGGSLSYFSPFGHSAVIAFFVISGYVIAFVADTKDKDINIYYISRFARLYSVVLPVLIIVPILDIIGIYINETMYEGKIHNSYFIIRLFANFTFLQEIWFNSIRYLSDGPLWSLGYELWYFVLFSFAIFFNNYKRYLLIGTAVLLIGPKILLLMPPWILGVWIYHFHKTKELSKITARILFFSAPLLFYIFFKDQGDPIVDLSFLGDFGYSKYFLHDYSTAVILGLFIASFKYVDISLMNKLLIKSETPIRYMASSTFTLYLFHLPLLLFYGAVLKHDPNDMKDIALLGFITFITCLFIAQYTERKKYIFKKYIMLIYEKISLKFSIFKSL